MAGYECYVGLKCFTKQPTMVHITSFSSKSSRDITSVVVELNKKMDSVFGEPPAITPASSATRVEPKMVHITFKEISERVAVATCKIILGRNVFDLVSSDQRAKGDVLTMARMAENSGANMTKPGQMVGREDDQAGMISQEDDQVGTNDRPKG
ncbi:cyclic pyranopterin monophosphate synthase [Sarracenia purpurea var. burkii]